MAISVPLVMLTYSRVRSMRYEVVAFSGTHQISVMFSGTP